MGHTWVAVNDNSRAGRDKIISFYRFRTDPDRKNKWIAAVNRGPNGPKWTLIMDASGNLMNILTTISGVDPELVDGGGAFHVGDLLITIKTLMDKCEHVGFFKHNILILLHYCFIKFS